MPNNRKSYFSRIILASFLLLLSCVWISCNNNSEKGSGKNADTTTTESTTQTTSEATTTPGPQYIRKNANSPEGQADLDAFNKAMAIMKNAPCDSTYSWYYQGGIHWVPNSVPNNKLCASYTQMSQLKTAWDNCTHGSADNAIHFLIWHRLYIWYFEKIVRKLSGKADFALPYWKYVDPGYRVMPAIFQNPANSLYEKEREGTLNQGQPIDQSFADQYLVQAMIENNKDKDYETFNAGIENAPHNYMHGYIGGNPGSNRIYQKNIGTGLMGAAGSAGFDPVFFVHHSNIDYLWEAWYTGPNGQAPILADLEANPWPYQYFDENGKYVKYTIAEALDKAFHLDYTYDDIKPLKAIKPAVAQNKQEILSSEVNAPVKKVQNMINLKVENRTLEMVATKDFSHKSVIMEVIVSFKTVPANGYIVYIDTDKPDPKKIAGYMTFFGLQEMTEAMPGMESSKKFLFNITDEYNIKSQKDNLKLLIVNSKGKPAGDITVKNIRIETRDF